MVKRKKMRLRHGDVLDVQEYHDGNYGARGKTRCDKEKPTKEQICIHESGKQQSDTEDPGNTEKRILGDV